MKRKLSLLMVGVMCLSVFAGCSKSNEKASVSTPENKTEQTTKAEPKKDKSNEAAKLKLFLHSRDIQDTSFSREYIEKATNTKLEIIQVTTKELENKLNIILASGDRPDIMNFYTDAMEDKLAKGKALVPFNEYIEKYPELKASREQNVWDAMRHNDGNIYSIGYSTANPLSIIGYRKDWLNKLGLEVPKTIEEYYEVAKAMALNDPDGNGEKDTFAFGGYGKVDRFMDHIFGAYGSLPNYWMEKDGKIVNGSVQPEMKEALKFMKKLFDEKIMDAEFVTDNSARWKTKVKAGTFGAGETKIHLFDKNNLQNYYAPFIKKNPEGEIVYGPVLQGASDHPVGVRMASNKGWVRTGVSSDSKNIEAAFRLLAWAASDEGNKFINYGLEGEHYKVENGQVVKLVDNATLKSLDVDKFYIAKKALFDHSSPELLDAFNYSASSALVNPVDGIMVDEAIKYEVDLNDFTNNEYIGMIVGATDIDTGFDAFVEEWNKRGGDKLTKALNEAYQQRK